MTGNPDWMRYEGQHVTYEWAGEPHASESIKRVDGVEVARLPQFIGPLLVESGSHDVWFDIPEGAERARFRYEFRSTSARDEESGGAHLTFSGFDPLQGRVTRFPDDGEWHSYTTPIRERLDPDADEARVSFTTSSSSSDWYEVRNFQVVFDDEPWPELWDGDTPDGPHGFTWDWWGRLPRHVQDADRVQQPIPVPLLRFLDGIGEQAGRTRDQNRAMWSGEILDPQRTADNLLPWVAFLIGFTRDQRDHPPNVLRESIADHLGGGTHQVGTRQQIAATIRPYLNPGARVQVLASASAPHTLIIGITPDDVPDQDYDRLARQIRAAGVVPAGHALTVQDIRATWDQWEAAAGTTWEDKQANIQTWQDSDYAGVELQ